eukprot:6429648-Prymnesium_polylepis.1
MERRYGSKRAGAWLRESRREKALAKAERARARSKNVSLMVAQAAKVAAVWEAQSCESDLPSKATLKLR